MSKKTFTIWLIVVMSIAVALRIVNMTYFSYMNDELSALSRLNYNSLIELIQKGIKPDGHLAGTQVLLYYYTHWVGDEAWKVRLPFIIASLIGLWCWIGFIKLYFNRQTAVLTGLFLASSQLFVMHAQLARPYSLGFMALGIMYLAGINLLRNPLFKFRLLYVVGGIIGIYTHYFALMQVGFAAVLFLMLNQNRSLFWKLNLLIFMAFIPHLPVSLAQLSTGGISGWLGSLETNFVFRFIGYLFHFSDFLAIVVLLFISHSLWFKGKFILQQLDKKWLLAILSFIIPLLIGYVYSLNVSTVLLYSCLIFSAPLLLASVFFVIGFISKPKLYVFAILLLVILPKTLIFDRQYYFIFDNQYFKNWPNSLSERNIESYNIFWANGEYIEFYNKQLPKPISFISFYDSVLSISQFKNILQTCNYNSVSLGNAPLEFLVLASEYFPYQEFHECSFTGDLFLFSKIQSSARNWHYKPFGNAVADSLLLWPSSTSQESRTILPSQEYGCGFVLPLNKVANNRHDVINCVATIEVKHWQSKPELHLSMHTKGKTKYWRLQNYIDTATVGKSKYKKLYLSVRLTDVYRYQSDLKETELRVFTVNASKDTLYIPKLELGFSQGNAMIYGTIQPIE